jgi:hypothetical protein
MIYFLIQIILNSFTTFEEYADYVFNAEEWWPATCIILGISWLKGFWPLPSGSDVYQQWRTGWLQYDTKQKMQVSILQLLKSVSHLLL